MTTPAVTVCIPAHNSAATLERAVASVRAQTFADWRLVISDDASDDATWQVAQAAAAADPRVTVERQAERRLFMNFGTALAAAETPYFVWLAADDYWAPRFLEATLEILDTRRRAVSALPRCRFLGTRRGAAAGPRTPTLDGPPVGRISAFLAAPGGTRMYGLMRTEVLRAAFPRQNMNAWDWYLMAGVLRAGAQIEVPEVLLYRERTDPMRYAEVVHELHRGALFRRFPVLRMSLAAVRAGHVPAANLGDLARLNLRKHEEYLAVMRPAAYARRARLFRALGLPIACRPGEAAALAARLVRERPERREGAARMLRSLVSLGDAAAAMEEGHLRRRGLLPGCAQSAYARAADLGLPDGWFEAATAARDAGTMDEAEAWRRIVAAAHCGSEAARTCLAAPGSDLPPHVAEIARFVRARPTRPRRQPARRPGTPPRLTAVLTCRNAAPTLERLLDHLAWSGAEVVVIDHGSTDDSRAIAESRRGAPVVEIIDEPFRGVFDLTRQLRQKREIIRGIPDGWILHADADEFVDSPDGTPLASYLGYWDDSDVVAFRCAEFMFLPRAEDDVHGPACFEATMRQYVHYRDRDPKQRLFRAGIPLDRWLRTGGHVAAGPTDAVCPVALPLRHYVGLSLDQIRAEYLSRVFAEGDVARLWHSSRMGAALYDVVPPAPDELRDARHGLSTDAPVTRLPVFRPRRREPTSEEPEQDADATVLAFSRAAAEAANDVLARAMPGVRLAVRVGNGAPMRLPVLHVVEHPCRGAPQDGDAQRAHAEAWLRHVARARQGALVAGVCYAEVRMEDLETEPEALVRTLRQLLLDGRWRGTAGFVSGQSTARRCDARPERVWSIAGALARDLGYR